MSDDKQYADTIASHLNLADARLGATVLWATDEFFGAKERLLGAAEPEWRAGVYDDHGKWMDGWETRRRRGPGHDECIVRLASRGHIALLDLDTRYFTGNYPPHAAIEACQVEGDPDEATRWSSLLPYSVLSGNQHNFFPVNAAASWTHLKLSIFPDGGVARLRVYGTIQRDWADAANQKSLDLVAALNGGRALACSDEHYGAMGNLLLPGRGSSMADGWETRRRRGPGFDWVILQLGHPGRVLKVEVDTAYFRGNFPHQVSINAARLRGSAAGAELAGPSMEWPTLLEPQLLQADSILSFETGLAELGVITHARVNMHPDGGMSRVRLYGLPDPG
jgi:allantoicase